MGEEAEIQRAIIEYCEVHGNIVLRLNAGNVKKGSRHIRLCPPGTPDLLIVRDGKNLWIEVKRPGESLRPEQKEMIAELESRGELVIVARSLDDVMRII